MPYKVENKNFTSSRLDSMSVLNKSAGLKILNEKYLTFF